MGLCSRNPSTKAIIAGCLVLLFMAGGFTYGTFFWVKTVRNFWIPSAAMAPTLLPGDRFYSLRLEDEPQKKIAKLKRGTVVTYTLANGIVYVSRIVGLPGDKIELVGRILRVNDIVHEPKLFTPVTDDDTLNVAPDTEVGTEVHDGRTIKPIWNRDFANPSRVSVTLGTEEVFLLSDNRDNSGADSRTKGPIPLSQIETVPAFIWFSSSELSIRTNRIFRKLN